MTVIEEDLITMALMQLDPPKPLLKSQLRENEFVKPDQVTIVVSTLNKEGLSHVWDGLSAYSGRQ